MWLGLKKNSPIAHKAYITDLSNILAPLPERKVSFQGLPKG